MSVAADCCWSCIANAHRGDAPAVHARRMLLGRLGPALERQPSSPDEAWKQSPSWARPSHSAHGRDAWPDSRSQVELAGLQQKKQAALSVARVKRQALQQREPAWHAGRQGLAAHRVGNDVARPSSTDSARSVARRAALSARVRAQERCAQEHTTLGRELEAKRDLIIARLNSVRSRQARRVSGGSGSAERPISAFFSRWNEEPGDEGR